MKPLRKRRLTFVLLIVLGLGAATALGLFALKENINLFYSPIELVEHKAPKNVLIRLGGLVVEGSVQRDLESLQVEFELTDNAGNVTVVYDGILPDLFREGQGIIANGKLNSNGAFVAQEVLAKHDENYMPPEIAAAMKNKVDSSKTY